MLGMTSNMLDLISDIDLNQFIEKCIIAGVSYIAQRCSIIDNKYMKCYKDKQSKHVVCPDINNFSGWAMIQCS